MAKSLELQFSKILKDYEDEVKQISAETLEQIAKETVDDLKMTSPRDKGRYAESWRYREQPARSGIKDFVVYNGEAGLTHLLENGHVVKPEPKHPGKKGRVDGQPHIRPAGERAKEKLIRMVEARL